MFGERIWWPSGSENRMDLRACACGSYCQCFCPSRMCLVLIVYIPMKTRRCLHGLTELKRLSCASIVGFPAAGSLLISLLYYKFACFWLCSEPRKSQQCHNVLCVCARARACILNTFRCSASIDAWFNYVLLVHITLKPATGMRESMKSMCLLIMIMHIYWCLIRVAALGHVWLSDDLVCVFHVLSFGSVRRLLAITSFVWAQMWTNAGLQITPHLFGSTVHCIDWYYDS